jgi:uncharacterized protein
LTGCDSRFNIEQQLKKQPDLRFTEGQESMRIQIEPLRERSRIFEFTQQADAFPVLKELARRDECEFLAPIRVRLEAIRVGEIIEVKGALATEVRLACGRCLDPFAQPLASDFELTYLQAPADSAAAAAAEDREVDADEIGVVHFRGEEIDLSEGIQEQVVLALPLRPLCRESCKGLCPSCGADRNRESCSCRSQPAEGPFAVLRRIQLNKE